MYFCVCYYEILIYEYFRNIRSYEKFVTKIIQKLITKDTPFDMPCLSIDRCQLIILNVTNCQCRTMAVVVMVMVVVVVVVIEEVVLL